MIFTEFKNNLLFMEIDTGETVTKGVLVSINKTNGKIKKGLPNNSYPIGIAQTGGTAGDFIYIVSSGSADTTSVLVPGEACFSDSNGTLFPESTATANNASFNVGVCSGINSVRTDIQVYTPPPVVNPNLSLNYIDASTADDAGSVNAYDIYADVADVKPVDGIGGTPNITLTRNITNPLSGTGDFRLTKDAVNRQGEGFSYLFTLQKRHQSKVLQVSFDYEIISGTYASGDIRVYVRNEDTSELFELSQRDLQSVSIGNKVKYLAEFQTSSSGSSYRMIIHISSVSASAYSLSFNNFRIWERTQTIGSVITEWKDYSPQFINQISLSGVSSGKYRRNGSNAEFLFHMEVTGAGGTGSSFLGFKLPNNLSIDFSRIGTNYSSVGYTVGSGMTHGVEATLQTWFSPVLADAGLFGTDCVVLANIGNNVAYVESDFPLNSIISFTASVPVLGWGSSVIMSEQSEGRLIAAVYRNSANTALASTEPINFQIKELDTHDAVTMGTGIWKFTAPEYGIYSVSFAVGCASVRASIFLLKNGIFVKIMKTIAVGDYGGNNTLIELNEGDYINIAPDNPGFTTTPYWIDFISIHKLQSPQSIGTSEKLCARYTSVSGQVLNTGDIINFETKDFDTHGAVTVGANWKFTAQEYGIYEVNAQYLTQNNSTVSAIPAVYKNGVLYMINYGNSPVGILGCTSIITLIELNKGDYIDIRHANATADSLSTTVGVNQISIKKVK